MWQGASLHMASQSTLNYDASADAVVCDLQRFGPSLVLLVERFSGLTFSLAVYHSIAETASLYDNVKFTSCSYLPFSLVFLAPLARQSVC
jgi:hypothetical protein